MSTDIASATQLSEDDSDDEKNLNLRNPPVMQGVLSKWTNYIHGWQDRYFVLRDGTLSYYRSQGDASFGCRGSISVSRAIVKAHEIDECRFDVCLNDSVWYLRTERCDVKHQWVDAFELHKENESLNRHGSTVSLSSNSVTAAAAKSSKGLRDKLAELETYRDILIKQMDALQSFFDACSDLSKNKSLLCNGSHDSGDVVTAEGELPVAPEVTLTTDMLDKYGASVLDFKGEALTFKATTAGIQQTLAQCVEILSQREEAYKRRLEKEVERRKCAEERVQQYKAQVEECGVSGGGVGAAAVGIGSMPRVTVPADARGMMLGGPDYEEGPHSVMGEDEFYDAVESTLDKMDEEDELRDRLRQRRNAASSVVPSVQHPLWPDINRMAEEHLSLSLEKISVDPNEPGSWMLFHEDGEMKLFRKEVEEDGLILDPCKGIHKVCGATAHEMTHYFWSPELRFDWDVTVEQLTILDSIDDNTIVIHQIHKRVWPIAQRDCLVWSHVRRLDRDHPELKKLSDPPYDAWLVSNKSTSHPDAILDPNRVRVDARTCFLCLTYIEPPLAEGETIETISRDRLIVKVTYTSAVNPGGWAPASVLRAVFKREYPKFLKRFTQFVVDKCKDQPIAFDGLKVVNKSNILRG
ncbi:ceramide transfer protein isoform X2 [Hyalella azteca]|uniref:Ceramide transfer protein isoform X2 n=1 Tax=Hyalella azteca TaxID=294128 RepID=A0A8B7P4G9_HYAAZ|nr:ceramide transfer protein isoform X2 [Hyalella azteca]